MLWKDCKIIAFGMEQGAPFNEKCPEILLLNILMIKVGIETDTIQSFEAATKS